MACNLNEEKKIERDVVKTGEPCIDEGDQLSAPSSTTSKQNGDQAGCEDEQMSEQYTCERQRSGLSDLRIRASSPGALHRSVDEWPRKSFQIPRKIKERRGLLQAVAPDSREFEEVVKLLSSSYLDASSRGAFTYTKAYLVHNELLEKEFIEKKRELKQAGRTDAELTDSYAFLLPDPNKTHWICEKGLSVGHARINNLGNPVKGVYLSKYSDLLQMNPFEVGASGDIIIFKVMKGRLKSIFENMPKNNVEPSAKFDCHVHKNGSKVTSLLSYRAFELTQQYFYEFAFEELRSRPRHVCPYAVLSFQYKGKELATGAHRLSSTTYEGHRGRRRYTVWSGPLVNKGEELYQVCIRSPSIPLLPFKLPDKIDIGVAMHLDLVKRKIPSTLLSWDTYSGTQEAMKCGMYCSLFDVMPKSKQNSCLSGLVHKMEKDKVVFVKPLIERGFLFFLLSSHMHNSNDRRGRSEKGLVALFVFQESRITARFMSRHSGRKEDSLVPLEPKDPITEHLDSLVPALHHAFFKLRSSPPKNLANAVKSQALDYLNLREQGSGRPFSVPEYRLSHDERHNPYPPQRSKSIDSVLNTYIHTPASFQLPVESLQSGLVDSGPAVDDDYSPVSDWSGSGSSKPAVAQSNGSGAQRLQAEYDKEKMEKLLKLIQMHKRATSKEDGSVQERSDDWKAAGHKRSLEGEGSTGVSKYMKTDNLSNGEPERVPQGDTSLSLSAVMDSIGLCDTDLREHVSQNSSINDAQTLLKLFFTAFKKVAQSSAAAAAAAAAPPPPSAAASATFAGPMLPAQLQESLVPDRECEAAKSSMQSEHNLHTRHAEEEQVLQDYLEEQMGCSIGSMDLCSPSSITEQQVQRSAITTQSTHNRLERRTSTTVSDNVGEIGTLGMNRSVQAAGRTLDSILDHECQSLCADIQDLMDMQKISYVAQPLLPRHQAFPKRLDSTFSPYILNYTSPLPIQGYINTLCEEINLMIHSPDAPSISNTKSPDTAQPVPATPPPPHPPTPLQADVSLTTFTPVSTPSPAAPPVVLHHKQSASKAKSPELLEKPTSRPQTSACTPIPSSSFAPKTQPSPTSGSHLASFKEKKTDIKLSSVVDSPKCTSSIGSTGLPLIAEIPLEPEQTSAAANNVIGQIKPEVLCTLVEIMQMNAVRFYIQQGDEEENQLFTEIKVYLKSLGNIECNPLTYLKNSSQQKLMVIIQNEDIASHIHKIPGLISLKMMSTVYFAGVDSLDDVKNRTYNELFVSGGLIVSDERTLNPDFITLEKLQGFLQFLEEQSGSWKWKVHCKTQKKLKELSRLNSQALDLLNLLTTYQKKHLVEFLPYHECDAPSRQAPDLDCLVKLQAHHTQLRHIIFLTDKCDEEPKFSSNGVITASLNDIMTNFESLISSIKAEVSTRPNNPTPVEPDACMDEEDMSLDSDEEASVQVEHRAAEKKVVQSPPPQSEECQLPITNPPNSGHDPLSSCPVDYGALKDAITQYKAAKHVGTPGGNEDENLASFGVNPHQSYLFPNSAQWSPYSGSPSNLLSSSYSSPACSSSHGQEYSQVSSNTLNQASTALPSQPANPHSLDSPVKPPCNIVPLAPPQISSPVPNFLPEASSCLQSSAQTQSLTGEGQSVFCGSEETKTKAMESESLSSSSSLPSTMPNFLDPHMFSVPPPIPPPLLPMFNWPPPMVEQPRCPPGTNIAPFGQNDAPALAEALHVESLTPNEKANGSLIGSASNSSLFPTGEMEQCRILGNLTPTNQDRRTQVNFCTDNRGRGHMPMYPMARGHLPNRGGLNPRGLLPCPGPQMPPMCRGGPQGPNSYREVHPFGPRGPMPGPMDMVRGGFRGRGMPPMPPRPPMPPMPPMLPRPPMPMRSRPGRGLMRDGGHCNWGFRGPANEYY